MEIETVQTIECNGPLFVGDPHVTSRKPGRRKDANYGATILDKIRQVVDIANKNDQQIVFLGDLFDRAVEPDESLKTRLLRELKRAKHIPVGIDGNHDKGSSVLSDSDTLKFMIETDKLAIRTTAGPIVKYLINGKTIGLGGSPHGFDIPDNVPEIFPDVDGVIWITHDDFAFEGAYPNAKELFEVNGVDMVVNGHMHLTKRPIQIGSTLWLNFGNITRMAVDAADHIPAVHSFHPDRGIERYELQYQRDIFDMTGRLVDSISPGEVRASGVEEPESVFVELLRAESAGEIEMTHDGSALLEDMAALFETKNTPEDVRTLVLRLHEEATKQAA